MLGEAGQWVNIFPGFTTVVTRILSFRGESYAWDLIYGQEVMEGNFKILQVCRPNLTWWSSTFKRHILRS